MHQKDVTILVAQKSKVDTLLAHDPHYFDAFHLVAQRNQQVVFKLIK